MGNRIKIDEGEMVEYIIEKILDPMLQDQARVQWPEEPEECYWTRLREYRCAEEVNRVHSGTRKNNNGCKEVAIKRNFSDTMYI
ncbi:hypothetical protein RF55_14606 [Lasius niger]|uniref:Uncharacterized protein n=1 Tax=Lasius niger TaxID=67767 RepID=A0A0J7K867_LASNI|nr:hypothetical protein RF55_14606 [Lasius niger]